MERTKWWNLWGDGTAYLFGSGDEAFGYGLGMMDGGGGGGWAGGEGWATSHGDAINRYLQLAGGSVNILTGYNYVNQSFSGAYVSQSFQPGEHYSNEGKETYYYAGQGNAFDFAAMQAGYAVFQRPLGDKILDAVHVTLDLVAFIPGANVIAGGLNATIYAAEGDYKNAALSAATMIPFEKILAGGAKLAMGLVKTEQYALRATESGFYPVMQRGFKNAQELQYLEQWEVWKFGTTKNPFTRYSQKYRDGIGEGVKYFREFKGLKSEAVELQNMKIDNYVLQNGYRPPGNKIRN